MNHHFFNKLTVTYLFILFSLLASPAQSTAAEHSFPISPIEAKEYKVEFQKIEQLDVYGEKWMLKVRDFAAIFPTLDIRLAKEEAFRFVATHGFIINRMPEHPKLVVGCGNLPSHNPDFSVYYIDNYNGGPGAIYRKNHSHSDADTMDPDYARNPTFVGAVEGQDLKEVIGNHRYKEILVEGIQLSLSAEKSLFDILETGGTLSFSYDERTYTKGERSSLSMFGEQKTYDDEERCEGPFQEEIEPCHSIDEFCKKYKTSKQEILKYTKFATMEALEAEIKADLWINFEYYWLSTEAKKEFYSRV